MKKIIAIFAITLMCILLPGTTMYSYATEINSGFLYDDGIISFDLEDFDMVPFRETDVPELKEDEDAKMIYEVFENTPSVKMVVLPKNLNYFWYLGVKDGKELSSLSDFSDEEVRSFNLSDYTETEIKNLLSNYTIDGFNKEFDSVGKYNEISYYVSGGTVTQNGESASVMSYTTIINGYYYMFILYPLNDSFSSDDLVEFHNFLSSIQKKTTEAGAVDKDESDSSINNSTEDEDRKNALVTSLMTIVPIAIVFAVVGALFKTRQKKKEQSNLSDKRSDGAVPKVDIGESKLNSVKEADDTLALTSLRSKSDIDQAEALKKYKQMLDDGLITQEDYDKLKVKLLDL